MANENFCVALFASLFLGPALLPAQGLDEVAIFGFVKNQVSGAGVSGVTVHVINEADTTERSAAITDANGRYSTSLVTSVRPAPGLVPADFRLQQNYPNPFNPSTVIQFQIAQPSDTRLVIYNTLGQRVRTLLSQNLASGEYSAVWDATNDAGVGVAAGVYFYQLRTPDFAQTNKMVLLDGSSGAASGFSQNLARSRPQTPVKKSSDLRVTVRAVGSRIVDLEQRNVPVESASVQIDLDVEVVQESGLNRDLVVVSEPDANGRVFVSGLPNAVIDAVGGVETVSITNLRGLHAISARVHPDGSIPLVSLAAQIGDEIAMTLARGEVPFGKTLNVPVSENAKPRVRRSNVTNGNKEVLVDAIIVIEFSEPIDVATVTENSFFLIDSAGAVPGTIDFLNENSIATLTPNQLLTPLTSYSFTVTTAVMDLQRLSLSSTFTVSFTTGSEEIDSLGKVLDPGRIWVSEPGIDGKVYVSGLADAIIDEVVGTEKVTVTNQRTGAEQSMRVNYDGSFPVMALPALIGDEITLTLSRKLAPFGQTLSVTVHHSRPPVVISTQPLHGTEEVVGIRPLFIHFSEAMDPKTLDASSFSLTDHAGEVSGAISWLNDNTLMSFTPQVPLNSGELHALTLTTEVMDARGTPLEGDFAASFTTAADAVEGKIIYMDPRDNSFQIMDGIGRHLNQITNDDFFDITIGQPSWSPDGTRIVFRRDVFRPEAARDRMNISLMNSDGTFQEILIPNQQGWYPRFSPDGTKIAFIALTFGDLGNLRIMNSNGTDQFALTEGAAVRCCPSWSPDGSKIAYSHRRTRGDGDVYVIDRDAGNAMNFTSSIAGEFSGPEWSPDGTEIAFARIDSPNEAIYLMRSDGTDIRRLLILDGLLEMPLSWSPDGLRILFATGFNVSGPEPGGLGVITRDGSNVLYFRNVVASARDPDWSPWPDRQR